MTTEYDGEYPNNSQQKGISIEKELVRGQTDLPGTLRPADISYSSANNIRTTSPDLNSILPSIQEQVGSSCQYSGRCANHSDKCSEVDYRDTCTVKDDFTFGWHGVGL